ncbi:hypothetical protein [Pseudomonas phytophila]|uniref:hypothetical protein n=1 Tax=Pseudomonas phytophila TaxID=2867264 RepID=UPI0021D905E3|nr:hypothetical protein [Pseudomonas phytophila]
MMQPVKPPSHTEEWYRSCWNASAWTNPSTNYRYLMRFADNLLKMGSVDEMERFEMLELATGAFCHHIEEAPPAWRNPAADYDIYDEAGLQTGSLSGNRVFLHEPGMKPGPMEFFAQIHEAEGDRPVITRTYAQYGVFTDRYIFTETVQKLTLVETGKLVDGKMIKRLDDPDTYRSIIDAGLIALEEGDMVRYVALWEREQFSIFRQCSSCCDRFELREDCHSCKGMGFIEDPLCPSGLPQSNAAHRTSLKKT